MEGAALLRELQVARLHRVRQQETANEDREQPGRLGRAENVQRVQLGPSQVKSHIGQFTISLFTNVIIVKLLQFNNDNVISK